MQITKYVMAEMWLHARDEAPREACGFLAACDDGLAARHYPMQNKFTTESGYEIDPAEHLESLKEAKEDGFSFCAVYHSHSNGRALPSMEDVWKAKDDQITYIVLSLDRGETRAFKIKAPVVTREEIEEV